LTARTAGSGYVAPSSTNGPASSATSTTKFTSPQPRRCSVRNTDAVCYRTRGCASRHLVYCSSVSNLRTQPVAFASSQSSALRSRRTLPPMMQACPRSCTALFARRQFLYPWSVSLLRTQPVACASTQSLSAMSYRIWPPMRQRACAGVAMTIARPEPPSNPSPESPNAPKPTVTTVHATATARTKPFASPREADLAYVLITLFILAPPMRLFTVVSETRTQL